jgi:hypothetical protein
VTQSPPPPLDPLNDVDPNSCSNPSPNFGPDPSPNPGPDLIDDPIVAGLRTLYQEVLAEPVPADFRDLLAQIDAALDALPSDKAGTEPDETENEQSS